MENKGRSAFVSTKSSMLYYGEILTIRDSLILLSPITNLSNTELLKNIDSIIIIEQGSIEYMKLQAIVHKQAWKSGLVGGLLGACYTAISYFSKDKEQRNLLKSSAGIPIGFLAAYFWGLSLDVRKSAPVEVFFPAEVGLLPLLDESRFKNGEPIEFHRAFDKIIFEFFEMKR